MSTKVNKLSDYLGCVEKLMTSNPGRFYVFRGQVRRWPVVPGIARTPFTKAGVYSTPGKKPRPAEYKLFVRFRDATVAYQPSWVQVPSPNEHDWRQVVLAQHYGLPTRLLDWTTKPLVALFFAVEPGTSQKSDGAVYKFDSSLKDAFTLRALALANPDPPLYRHNDIGLLWPPDIDSRVASQGSMFTIGRDPRKPVAKEPLCVIPAAHKARIFSQLRRLGVTCGPDPISWTG